MRRARSADRLEMKVQNWVGWVCRGEDVGVMLKGGFSPSDLPPEQQEWQMKVYRDSPQKSHSPGGDWNPGWGVVGWSYTRNMIQAIWLTRDPSWWVSRSAPSGWASDSRGGVLVGDGTRRRGFEGTITRYIYRGEISPQLSIEFGSHLERFSLGTLRFWAHDLYPGNLWLKG